MSEKKKEDILDIDTVGLERAQKRLQDFMAMEGATPAHLLESFLLAMGPEMVEQAIKSLPPTLQVALFIMVLKAAQDTPANLRTMVPMVEA